ncbi:MAG: flagellar filament capping protein FliD [Pirellulaceae bacterium]
MGRIQSDIGLITGINIKDTVDKLIALQGRTRDLATERQAFLKSQQTAVTELLALTIGVQIAGKKFKDASLYTKKDVTSSNAAFITAAATGAVAAGTYQFVPVRKASTSHLLAGGVASRDAPLGVGTFSFRQGPGVDQAADLSEVNGGSGIAPGKIRITDRSGETAVIDLRYAHNVDDVLAAINQTDGISVQAQAVGDRLRLVDTSGGTGNLKVGEVSGGTTAASLGLGGINVAADSATGQDIVRLFSGLDIGRLNDGNGLSIRAALPDLHVTLRDGTSIDVDFRSLTVGARQEKSLGDLLATINEADPARLQAALSADGDHLVLTDLSTDTGGTFAVTSPSAGNVAEELGLTGAAVGGVITSEKLLGGLASASLRTLGGGQGLGQLGLLSLTDRSGAAASIDLAAAATLDEVIEAINAAGIGITADFNGSRTGLELTDSTGSTSGNLIVASGDATGTAEKLQLAVNAAQTRVDSGDLHRQVVNFGTLLSSYNAGQGVSNGSFLITNSNGQSGGINLTQLAAKSIGDIITAINGLGIGVEAKINDAGDGIALIDTAGGSGSLVVAEVGNSTTAADLHLLGTGTPTTIDGSTTAKVTLTATDTLDNLVTKINALNAGVNAGIVSDSSGSLRYHLSLTSSRSGKAGQIIADGSSLGISFTELAKAQDALVQLGGAGGSSQLLTSSTNTFKDVTTGLDITLTGESTDPVTVTVADTSSSIASQVQLFVDQYNKLRDKLESLTFFNQLDQTKGILFGSSEALRLDSDLSRLITGRYFGVGPVQNLAQIGVSVGQDGKLGFDKTKLETLYASDPEGVKKFFGDDTLGFGAKAEAAIESLVGIDNSLLVNRASTLDRQVQETAKRIEALNSRLDRSREAITNDFYRMELAINKIRANLTSIGQIQNLFSTMNSSNNSN